MFKSIVFVVVLAAFASTNIIPVKDTPQCIVCEYAVTYLEVTRNLTGPFKIKSH